MDDYAKLYVKLIDAMNEALENKKLTFVPCSKEFISAVVDAIEQLVKERDNKAAEYEILVKMYAKANEDLCVRTKERDAAVKDIGWNCIKCKHYDKASPNYGYTEECENCGTYPWFDDEAESKWEWRGVQE